MLRAKNDLLAEILSLPNNEKLELVDKILTQLDKPDPELDKIWADEARKRWESYRQGRLKTVSYEDVMAPFRHL